MALSDRDCRHGRQIGKCADCDLDHIEMAADAEARRVDELTALRKQDTALIRQLVDALDECKDSTQERIDTLAESGIDKHKPRYFRSYVQDLQRAADAILAARARLEGKP